MELGITSKSLKIHFISDTHTKHRELILPGGDVIVHCGDIMSSGLDVLEALDFLQWFDGLDYTHKIFIAGNHERIFEDNRNIISKILEDYPGITYLQDSSIIIDGYKFYGTPWTPEFYGWAFAYHSEIEGSKIFDLVPADTDVFISHGPSFGKLDVVQEFSFLEPFFFYGYLNITCSYIL